MEIYYRLFILWMKLKGYPILDSQKDIDKIFPLSKSEFIDWQDNKKNEVNAFIF